MPLDGEAMVKVGQLAQDFMDVLRDHFPDDEHLSLGTLMIVAEVCDDKPDDPGTFIQHRCTDARVHVQRGIVRTVQLSLDAPHDPGGIT